jgi:copper(I)-binding protein
MVRPARLARLTAMLAALALAAGCAGSGAGSLGVSDPWVRYTGPEVAAGGFMVVTNDGTTEDALVSASSPTFESIELHETLMMEATPSAAMGAEGSAGAEGSMGAESAAPMGSGGMVGMQPVDSIPVPVGGSVELKPGSYHLMLFDPTGTVEVGGTVEITLTFESGATVTTQAEIRAP